MVDHHARVVARCPERLPVLGIERGNAGTGGNSGQQHTAAQPQLGDLCYLNDGFVKVPEQDLAHPGAPLGRQRAEVSQPAIVRTQAGPAQLELASCLRLGRSQTRLRKERWHRVGEEDLDVEAAGVGVDRERGARPERDALAVRQAAAAENRRPLTQLAEQLPDQP